LLAAIGTFLGWQMLPFTILLASLFGIVYAVLIMVAKKRFKSEPLAFGPCLILAGFIALNWGKAISDYYLQTW
jgi:leader peptidase (prepilin peptidase) / N-methyltransferase